MADFKGIPIHPAAPVKSGEKYQTSQGFTAIKDGIKQSTAGQPFVAGRKPPWLRADRKSVV
jgi:lipoic acid synthetase